MQTVGAGLADSGRGPRHQDHAVIHAPRPTFPVVSPGGVPAESSGCRSVRDGDFRRRSGQDIWRRGRRSPERLRVPLTCSDGAESTPAAGVSAACIRTTIRVPLPSTIGDWASTVPPMATTSSDTMASPRPEPFRRPLTRSETKWRSKTRCELFGEDARPVVDHPEGGHPLHGRRSDDHLALRKGGGVLDQVGEHLHQAVRVGPHPEGGLGAGGRHQVDAELRGRVPESIDHLVDGGRGIDRNQVEGEAVGVEAGEVEEVLHQALETPSLRADDAGCVGGLVGRPVDDRVGIAADRGQRRTQLVRDRQEELPFLFAGAAGAWPPWC